LLTGALSDRLGRKGMIVGGMLLQGMAIGLLPLLHSFAWWVVAMTLLGLGTALVYPTLLAAVSDVAHPDWREESTGSGAIVDTRWGRCLQGCWRTFLVCHGRLVSSVE